MTISTQSIIRNTDNITGTQEYPFLTGNWEIRSYPVSDEIPVPDKAPTLRWVKDDKISDLHTGQTTDEFLNSTALGLHLNNGAANLSKRISRLMRPYLYSRFFQPHEVIIEHANNLNSKVWDGAALISRRLVDELGQNQTPRRQKTLANARRVAFTIMHTGGQEKGHALIVNDLAVDVLLPQGSTKTEINMTGRVFVGIEPVHSHDNMRLDRQSLINLHPFIQPEMLLAFLHTEAALFLDKIRSGEIKALLTRLARFETEQEMNELHNWWLNEYLASGGSLMWFSGTIRAMANQHTLRLKSGAENARFPIIGGYYYLFPAEIGNRQIAPGHVELDPLTATAWVNTNDWHSIITKVLGGCDNDDAVWVLPFTDHDKAEKMLLWRSPNQVGEYIILQPTANSHTIQWHTTYGTTTFPPLDSRKLPPRIDTCHHTYGRLDPFPKSPHSSYSVAAMTPIIKQAATNHGVLGAYCNMLMITKALYGKLPANLPARLEDVIDGAIRSTRDLTPIREWCRYAASRITQQNKPVPSSISSRLESNLNRKQKEQLRYTEKHWLDTLETAVANHIHAYKAEIVALTAEAAPPAAVIEHGYKWAEQGKQIRQLYQQGISQKQPFDKIADNTLTYLSSWNNNNARWILLGALTDAIHRGGSDAAAWQKTTAHKTISALRAIGIIGEPTWTRIGAVLWYDENIPTVVPLQVNGVWYNWLKTQGHHFSTMSNVPAQLRDYAKAKITELVTNGRLLGQVITTQTTNDNRVITYTTNNNLFGYVQKGQELTAIAHPRWNIQSAIANDGNLFLIAAAA